MIKLREAATDFLNQRRIAVAGVSHHPEGGHSGNGVYKRLRERGYEVFAVNPNADEVEGDPCYHSLADIPGGVDAVLVSTTPEVAEDVVSDCVELGITRVWLHRAFGPGSMSGPAVEYGRAHGVDVIPGGCPLMFDPASDPGHKMMRALLTLTGTVPRKF
jgi:predicted CoA-binding protein